MAPHLEPLSSAGLWKASLQNCAAVRAEGREIINFLAETPVHTILTLKQAQTLRTGKKNQQEKKQNKRPQNKTKNPPNQKLSFSGNSF